MKASLASRRSSAWAVAAALVFPTLLAAIYFVWLAGSRPAVQRTVYGACKAVQFAFPLVWVFGAQRRRPDWSRLGTAGVAEGLLFGVAVFALAVAVYYLALRPTGLLAPAAAPVRDKIASYGVDTLAKYAALGTFLSVIHSLLEEYYWRWFCFGELQRLVSWKPAVALSSVGFMGHHVIVLATFFGWLSAATWLFSLAVAAGGAYWAWLYRRSGSLVGPWLGHVAVDVAIFVVGYDLVGGLR